MGVASASDDAKVAPSEPDVAVPIKNDACDYACTMEYNPVCALPRTGCGDCRTFGNGCSLGLYNCQNPLNRKNDLFLSDENVKLKIFFFYFQEYYSYALSACDSIGKEDGIGPIFEIA